MSESNARFLKDYTQPDFYIDTVDLTFDLEDTKTTVTNTMSFRRNGTHNRALVLDGEGLNLLSLKLNDITLSHENFKVNASSLTVSVSEDDFELTIETEINPKENKALEGLYKSGDAFCTQCEAEGFRRISYYLDRPDVMASFTTKVIADKTLYPFLLSNGNKVASGDLPNNKHYVDWQDPHKKPCYLFALVAGNFDLLEDRYLTQDGRDVCLQLFVDKGNLPRAQHAMDSLIKSMRWDEDRFNLCYDLDIYMIVAVDFFNMGAMENKGLNVFNSKYVLADTASATDEDYFNIEAVIGHEYFHNWTGNRVTCRDWFQLSLKEGLTVFRDQEFSADMHSASVNRIKNVRQLRAMQFPEDAGPMSHPIRPEKVKEMNNFYTFTVYEKGAEVIRMMHTLLGEEKFQQGMALYFERHDAQAVTCDDFVCAMEDASGVDLSQFRRWYSQSGTPELIVDKSFNASNKTLNITLSQRHKPTHDQSAKDNLHIPVAVELIDDRSNQRHLLNLTEASMTWTFDGFNNPPVVAVLCDFSAPVNLTFNQTEAELICVLRNAENEFCRWDAGQQLLKQQIGSVATGESNEFSQDIVSSFGDILKQEGNESFSALQLTLPAFDELLMSCVGVDTDELVRATSRFKREFAQKYQSELEAKYQDCVTAYDDKSSAGVAKRELRNVCLSYLACLSAHESTLASHANDAENMTDAMAALKAAANEGLACFDNIMANFEQKWRDNTLVMDKWFMVSASYNHNSIFERLSELIDHTLFSYENPNRARSLIGAFAQLNPKHYHNRNGDGYRFIADQVIKLDSINPQVASRMITPLIQFQGLDADRQSLVKAELKRIASVSGLSKDVEEKVSSALT